MCIRDRAGTGAPYINGGDVKNTGVELALTWDDTLGKDFKYNISLNGSYKDVYKRQLYRYP